MGAFPKTNNGVGDSKHFAALIHLLHKKEGGGQLNGGQLNTLGLVAVVLFGGTVYFLPTIIGIARSKRNAAAIGVLNALLGWTILGWIVALIWATTVDANAEGESRGRRKF